jgi:hypothetical protein
MTTKKGVIGILTGGGDVPGLNPAIRAVTIRALREGCQVIGFRRGWAGLVDMVREKDYDNSENFQTAPAALAARFSILRAPTPAGSRSPAFRLTCSPLTTPRRTI